jgi:multidrug efflux pump subunit AcrA (membrane-fusion protein)
MDRHWSPRIDERERGRQRLRRLTGWTVAGALAATTVFGVAFAYRGTASATPASGGTTTGGSTDGTTNGTGDDSSGGNLQPPAQAPSNPRHGGGVPLFSGGS